MLGFFAAFGTKLPSVAVHTWLPCAHTQGPTAGSVILAGILLKTSAYGLIRLAVSLFPYASQADLAVASRSGDLAARRGSAEEWIPQRQRREPAEIAIGGPELGDAVRKAHRGDSGIVDHRPDDLSRRTTRASRLPSAISTQRAPLTPATSTMHRSAPWPVPSSMAGRRSASGSRWPETHARKAKKTPEHMARGQRIDAGTGLAMPLRGLSMSVDEDAGVGRDQPPRPS